MNIHSESTTPEGLTDLDYVFAGVAELISGIKAARKANVPYEKRIEELETIVKHQCKTIEKQRKIIDSPGFTTKQALEDKVEYLNRVIKEREAYWKETKKRRAEKDEKIYNAEVMRSRACTNGRLAYQAYYELLEDTKEWFAAIVNPETYPNIGTLEVWIEKITQKNKLIMRDIEKVWDER